MLDYRMSVASTVSPQSHPAGVTTGEKRRPLLPLGE